MVCCNTCKITGAANGLFPQRPCSPFPSSSFFPTSFLYLILSRVNELFTKCRCSPHSREVCVYAWRTFSPRAPTSARSPRSPSCVGSFASTWLFAAQAFWPDRWSLHCSSQSASLRHSEVLVSPSSTLLQLSFAPIRWIIEYTHVIQLEIAT